MARFNQWGRQAAPVDPVGRISQRRSLPNTQRHRYRGRTAPPAPFDPARMVNFAAGRPQSQTTYQPVTTPAVAGNTNSSQPQPGPAAEQTTGDDEAVSQSSVSMDTTNDQDAALEKLAEAAKKAAEKVAEKAAENRREPSPPTSRLEGELDPTNDQEKDGTSNSAAPPSPPTNTFWDMSHQQCSDTLHTQNSAEPCFRSGAYDPMIGGRELHALISEQNSIDQTLDGGLGGMEDDEDFLQFVTRAQLIRRRTGIAPRMNADVQDVVRYTDQRYTGEGTATGDWLPQPHCWRHAKTTVRGFRDVSEG